MNGFSVLRDKSTVIIFTYAPAGLGHLRVTNALYQGLPEDVSPILMGADDKGITLIHRITSVNPFLRTIMEKVQYGIWQNMFTYLYRGYLRANPTKLHDQITAILKQNMKVPKTLLFVSTHFGLAHQLAAIKAKLSLSTGTKIFLAVIVTDDSPQHIWYVPGADIIFTPSQTTTEQLRKYNHSKGKDVKIVTAPYPVSPLLFVKSIYVYQSRLLQAKNIGIPVQVAIPISGAAVGTNFYTELIENLHKSSDKFHFHIISKVVSFTKPLLDKYNYSKYVSLHYSNHDREVIHLYDEIYRTNQILLEITKPSEQAFKSLITPDKIGGAILLLNDPVGRQEYDNLNFLIRHYLLPTQEENAKLLALMKNNKNINDDRALSKKAHSWRAIRLPGNPKQASQFINWALKTGLFTLMLNYKRVSYSKQCDYEISPDGVDIIWQKISELLSRKTINSK
jgi:hypothetical protein